MKRRSILLLICAVGFVVLYGASYVVNSTRGGYWTTPERTGGMGFVHVDNVVRWQPGRGYLSPRRADLFGKFYAPLIWLDRQFVHRTYLIKLDRSNPWLTEMAVTDIHPQCWSNLWWKQSNGTPRN